MIKPGLCQERRVGMYRDGKMQMVSDVLVVEKPLSIFFNDTEIATLVCSPEALKELGVGFLISEGLLHSFADIKELSCNEEEGLLWVRSNYPEGCREIRNSRHVNTCNGKGQAGLPNCNEIEPVPLVRTTSPCTAAQLLHLISLLEEKSVTFRRTGGVHSAALADSNGLLARYEDVGRHNAVDKSLGFALLNQVDPDDKILVLSGRIASEILLKAARSRIPLVLSRSAPTYLAVELANKLGITVVGFARGEQLNVYSYMERVLPTPINI
ncbi:MAG: formate dehydrogenase family accessory protein FdhD [Firmicutes bacterium HGW-Firmicutes-15]|nr:MAG: formate dehydrogenase family accessory protein FdhD [Firmicutes bacterium HGW-Firmicutes-15]